LTNATRLKRTGVHDRRFSAHHISASSQWLHATVVPDVRRRCPFDPASGPAQVLTIAVERGRMTQAAGALSTAETTSRVAWVDAAKGLSIVLVVFHHTVYFLDTSGLAPAPVVAGNEALASLRMPLFFLASGLFVAGPLAAPWRTLLHKRVAFFLWLYLLWTLIRFTFFATLVPPGIDPDDSANPLNVILALLLPGPSMWFLYALALFSVIGKLLRRVPVAVQLAASGVLSALAGAGLLEFDSRWTYMSRFLFFFLLGWHAKQLIERLARASSLLKVAAAAVACIAAAGGAVVLDVRTVPGVAWALNCVAVVFGVLFAAWISRYVIGRPLVALGRRTLPIYLTHMLWLAAIVAGIRHLDFPSVVAYALPVVITIALVGLSLMTHRLLVRAGGTWLFALPLRLAHRTPATQPAS
jgi:uncharacterized membrane protein YcfT